MTTLSLLATHAVLLVALNDSPSPNLNREASQYYSLHRSFAQVVLDFTYESERMPARSACATASVKMSGILSRARSLTFETVLLNEWVSSDLDLFERMRSAFMTCSMYDVLDLSRSYALQMRERRQLLEEVPTYTY